MQICRFALKNQPIFCGNLRESLLATVQQDANWERGEIVLLFAGHTEATRADSDYREQIQKVLKPLMQELPLKQAVSLTVKITGARKNEVYDLAIAESQG